MQDGMVTLWSGQFLSTSTGYVASQMSSGIRMSGNKVVVSVMTIAISASSTLTIAIDSTVDGSAWKEESTTTATTAPSSTLLALASVANPLIRVRLTLTGTSVAWIGNVSLGTSAQ